jgi:hypothetical protein
LNESLFVVFTRWQAQPQPHARLGARGEIRLTDGAARSQDLIASFLSQSLPKWIVIFNLRVVFFDLILFRAAAECALGPDTGLRIANDGKLVGRGLKSPG